MVLIAGVYTCRTWLNVCVKPLSTLAGVKLVALCEEIMIYTVHTVLKIARTSNVKV